MQTSALIFTGIPNTAWLRTAVLETSYAVYWIIGVTHVYKNTSKHEALQNTSGTVERVLIFTAVCCGVRGRALASHTDGRGFESQCGGRLFLNLLTTLRRY